MRPASARWPAQSLWRWRGALAWCLSAPLAQACTGALLRDGGAGSWCVFRRLTGCDCPLCGGTHALHALCSLDWVAAWQAQAGLLPLLLGGWLYLGALAWRAGRLPQRPPPAGLSRAGAWGLRLALGFWLGEWVGRLAALAA